jgi:hypothetical protein
MTTAEAKVNEFANKILDYIEQSEQQNADPKWILQGVKGYPFILFKWDVELLDSFPMTEEEKELGVRLCL